MKIVISLCRTLFTNVTLPLNVPVTLYVLVCLYIVSLPRRLAFLGELVLIPSPQTSSPKNACVGG